MVRWTNAGRALPGAPRYIGAVPPRPLPPVPPGRSYTYLPGYVSAEDRSTLLAWLGTLSPIWEQRYSTRRPPPRGETQRGLLRPVYWLGNWQFACLGYYEPPRRTRDCAVAAEPFPPALKRLSEDIERRVRKSFPAADVPRDWTLNTCLVNFYGHRRQGERWEDAARVGDHMDREPGPVASLSFGERARLQFVRRGRESLPPVKTEWLEDSALQVFGGPLWKDSLLHRVQRVEDKGRLDLAPSIPDFRTRRINLTLRYVPVEDIVPLERLSPTAREDVLEYVTQLAQRSPFWAAALARTG